jgi:hypothetical protein
VDACAQQVANSTITARKEPPVQLFSSLRQRMTGRPQTRRTTPRKPPPRFRPTIEALEGRDVPSTTWTVTNNSDTGGYNDGSLRGEIAAAQSGDTIVFAPNLQTITLSDNPNYGGQGQLEITTNLTIQGPGAGLLAISGAQGTLSSSRIFQVDPNVSVTLSGLTLEDGGGWAFAQDPAPGPGPYLYYYDECGGAILNLGTLTVNGCTLSHNNDYSYLGQGYENGAGGIFGGAIYNAGTLTVSNSTL